MFMYFLVVLAWPICIISLLILLISIHATIEYERNPIQKAFDKYNGFKRTWQISKSFIIFIISIVYIITYYNY